MIGREYFTVQAATLLKLADITRSETAAAALKAKAAELQAKAASDVPLHNLSPKPPEVELPK